MRFIVATPDGMTYDASGDERENLQILDFIEAKDEAQAREIAMENLGKGLYGAYQTLFIYRS